MRPKSSVRALYMDARDTTFSLINVCTGRVKNGWCRLQLGGDEFFTARDSGPWGAKCALRWTWSLFESRYKGYWEALPKYLETTYHLKLDVWLSQVCQTQPSGLEPCPQIPVEASCLLLHTSHCITLSCWSFCARLTSDTARGPAI